MVFAGPHHAAPMVLKTVLFGRWSLQTCRSYGAGRAAPDNPHDASSDRLRQETPAAWHAAWCQACWDNRPRLSTIDHRETTLDGLTAAYLLGPIYGFHLPQAYPPARKCARMLAAVALKGQLGMNWQEVLRLADRPEYPYLSRV